MKTRQGFTLIELLVVVLIIGILSAVALPQFQTAIDKSRYATLMPLAKSVANAQENYYMAAGNYSPDLAYLDVQLPTSPSGNKAEIGTGTTVEISDDTKYDYVKISKSNLENNYLIYQDNSSNFPKEIHCEALKGSARAERLCKTLGGQAKSGSLTAGYDTYLLEGAGEGDFPPAFVQNWKAAGIPQETIEKIVEAMTLLKQLSEARLKYYEEHGNYGNFDDYDVNIPQNLRANNWISGDAQNPDTYMFGCSSDGSCIATAANTDLPMFQYGSEHYGLCMSNISGKGTNVENMCRQMTVSENFEKWGYHYYSVPDDFSEL